MQIIFFSLDSCSLIFYFLKIIIQNNNEMYSSFGFNHKSQAVLKKPQDGPQKACRAFKYDNTNCLSNYWNY